MRPATSQDGPAVAALAALAGGSGWWGVEQRVGPDRADQARFVEVDGDDIIAYGCVWRRKHAIFGLDTLVRPERRGRGLAARLIDRLFEELAARGAAAVEARVDANHADALAFLVRRGFVELNRLERVRLDLDRAEIAEPTVEGIDFATLAEMRDPELVRGLHAFLSAAFREKPMRHLDPFTETPLEDLVDDLDAAAADGCFIARAGADIVGFSGLVDGPEPGTLLSFMTAVRPDLQGRGIATALKQRAIGYAKRSGYRAIFAVSPNPAMTAVHEKLGYVRHAPTEIRMGRRLQ
ncbi:MAG TPA: GNAT family N-acetyltransferase [Haliangiales bacterium]|nr:GNAT family N-acetyltransferase [Haliangiales bacterium]